MKNTTLRLVWITFFFMAAFTAVAILSENMPLIGAMLSMSMILLPMAVYRVLRDGQRTMIRIERKE